MSGQSTIFGIFWPNGNTVSCIDHTTGDADSKNIWACWCNLPTEGTKGDIRTIETTTLYLYEIKSKAQSI